MATVGYTTTEELQRILKIRTATTEQTVSITRVLTTAQVEIDSEINRDADSETLTADQLLLLGEVQLERAVEHWQQQESPFGILGLGADLGVAHTATDSWNRHAAKLAPVKARWGLA